MNESINIQGHVTTNPNRICKHGKHGDWIRISMRENILKFPWYLKKTNCKQIICGDFKGWMFLFGGLGGVYFIHHELYSISWKWKSQTYTVIYNNWHRRRFSFTVSNLLSLALDYELNRYQCYSSLGKSKNKLVFITLGQHV
jgi:hypothetical protein